MAKKQMTEDVFGQIAEQVTVSYIQDRSEQRQILSPGLAKHDVTRSTVLNEDDVSHRGRTSVIAVNFQIAAAERALDFLRLGDDPDPPRPEWPGQIRYECSRHVELGKFQAGVERYHVSARRKIGEMIAFLCEQRTKQP